MDGFDFKDNIETIPPAGAIVVVKGNWTLPLIELESADQQLLDV